MKNPVFTINTFNAVQFPENKKPMVICNIDHVFLRPINNYSYYHQQLKYQYADADFLDGVVKYILNMLMKTGIVKQSDPNGFAKMLNKIKTFDGKFLFITNRDTTNYVTDLIKAGLQNADDFEIHCTDNKIKKGNYISNYICLENYNHFIFIDNNINCIESVRNIYPESHCYLFTYD